MYVDMAESLGREFIHVPLSVDFLPLPPPRTGLHAPNRCPNGQPDEGKLIQQQRGVNTPLSGMGNGMDASKHALGRDTKDSQKVL